MAVQIEDLFGPLVLRTWFERDGLGTRIEFSEQLDAAIVLRRIAGGPGALHHLRRLVAELAPSTAPFDDATLLRHIAQLLVRGTLELVRLPHQPMVSTPVERSIIEPDEFASEFSGIPEVILFRGRLDAPTHGLEVLLDDTPPPDLLAKLEGEPPPELEFESEMLVHDLDFSHEISTSEFELEVGLGRAPIGGGSNPTAGGGSPGTGLGLGSDRAEPLLESNLQGQFHELDTALELPPEERST